MAHGRVPTDVVGDDLVATYHRGIRRLEEHIELALRRGLDPSRAYTPAARRGDASVAYRARQLAQARAILDELERAGAAGAGHVTRRAYTAGLVAVGRTLSDATAVAGQFGGIHQRAAAILAGNLERSLTRAAATARDNLETVFDRAAELDGPLPLAGGPTRRFIGRRVDDPWRRVSLEELGAGMVSLDTRKQISRGLIRRLLDEGIADALTGFIDAGGRRWSLDTYAEMVVRTTTREATSRATVNRLGEHGLNLIAISSHPHQADVCTPYDGRTFSTFEPDDRYPVIDRLPPFHPRCRHVVGPADTNLDDYEAELERAAAEQAGRTPTGGRDPARVTELESEIDLLEGRARHTARPSDVRDLEHRTAKLKAEAREARGGFADGPFDGGAPTRGPGTLRRREAEELVDSFVDEEERAARIAAQDAEAEAAAKFDRKAKAAIRRREREESAAIDAALGPDLVEALADLRAAGVKWAGEADLKQSIAAGEVDVDFVLGQAQKELAELEDRRLTREEAAGERGYSRKSIPCFVCGRFKARPSDVCGHCGDDPGSYRGDSNDLDEAYGYRRHAGRTHDLGVKGRGVLIQ
jgi:hypothetical protein